MNELELNLDRSPYGWNYCIVCGSPFTMRTANHNVCSQKCRNERKRQLANYRYRNNNKGVKPKTERQKAIEKYGHCTGGSLEKCLNCVYPDCVYTGQDTSDISYISHETKDFSVKVAKEK